MEPIANGGNGRQKNGRFAKGNPGGPGNPQAAKVMHLRRAIISKTTAKDIQDMFAALFKQGLAGDVQAARLWLEHNVGKPATQVELSGPEGEPIVVDSKGERYDAAAVVAKFIGVAKSIHVEADSLGTPGLAQSDDP